MSPRKLREAGALDPRTRLHVLNPRFEGNGIPWMRRALCPRYPFHWWETYDTDRERSAEERIRIAHGHDKAIKICEVCPVREDCLEFALKTAQPANIWGGLNPVQRNKKIRETADA